MKRKAGVLLSYVMMVFEVMSTLLVTPFIIRTLGQAEFGVYKLSAAVTAYLMLLDLGVGNAIVRYIAKYRVECNKEKERQFFGVAIVFYIVMGVLSFCIGLGIIKIFPRFFSNGLNAEELLLGQKLLFITMLNCAVTLSTSCFENIILAYEEFAVSRLGSIIQIIVKIVATIAVLKLGLGSLGIVTVQLVLTILLRMFLLGYVFFKMKIYPKFRNIEVGFVKEIITYSMLIFVQMIATQLNSSVDQILLGHMVSASAVIIGIYGIGTQVVQYYQQIGGAFTSVLMPGVVQMVYNHADSKQILTEMVRIGRIILMVLALIWGCFLVNGKEFILLWAGAENTDAYYVTVILMFAYMFILTESIGSQILWAMNEHKEQSYLKIGIVLLNIFLTILLIKWNPLIGATIGTFISLMLGDVGVMNLIFIKKLHINLKDYYREIFIGIVPGLIITGLAGIVLSQLIGATWIGFLFKNSCMVLIYGLCMFRFGMNDYEKRLVLSVVNMKK